MLKDKLVVITGGAGLLGRELVKAVASQGGVPVIAEINVTLAEEIKNQICLDLGIDHIYVHELDITSEKSIQNLIVDIHTKFGRIDALVNNAYPRNKNYGKHFFDVEYSDFCENLGLNLGGYFLTSKIFAKYFCDNGCGNIINISSIYGVIAPRFEIYEETPMTMPVEYAAIKSGLIHLTKYMAKYFKGKHIRVNSISLGGIEDNQPIEFLRAYKDFCLNKGMLENTDISGTLVYLLSSFSEYVNGQNLVVDDGFTL